MERKYGREAETLYVHGKSDSQQETKWSVAALFLGRLGGKRPRRAVPTRQADDSWSDLFFRWLGQRKPAPALVPVPVHRPLRTVRLEERRLLSVTAGVNGNVLEIVGDGLGSDETVRVEVDYMTDTLELFDELNNNILIDGNASVTLGSITGGLEFDLKGGNDTIITAPIDSLSITVIDDLGTDEVRLSGDNSITGGAMNITAEEITLTGDFVLGGDFTANGSVEVLAATTFDVTGQMDFTSTVTSMTGSESLDLTTTGTVTFQDAVFDLGLLTIDSQSSVSLESLQHSSNTGQLDITSSTGVQVTGAISGFEQIDVQSSGLVDFNDAISQAPAFAAGSNIDIAADSVEFDADVSGFNSVAVDVDTELRIAADLFGIDQFTVTGTGQTRFNGAAAQSVSADAIDIQVDAVLDQHVTLDGESSITLANVTDGGAVSNLTLESEEITTKGITGVGTLSMTAIALGPAGGNILVQGDVTDVVNVSVEATRLVTFEQTLTGTGAGTFALTSATTATFNQNSGGLSGFTQLDVTADDAVFVGALSSLGPATVTVQNSVDFQDTLSTVSSLTLDGNGTGAFGADVSVTGDIDITLAGNTDFDLTTLSAQNLTVQNTVSVSNSANFTIGSQLSLMSSLTGAAGVNLTASADTVSIDGAIQTFDQLQLTGTTSTSLAGNVSGVGTLTLLGGPVELSMATITADNVAITPQVTVVNSLTIDADQATFDGVVQDSGASVILQLIDGTDFDFNANVTGFDQLLITSAATEFNGVSSINTVALNGAGVTRIAGDPWTNIGEATFSTTVELTGAIKFDAVDQLHFLNTLSGVTMADSLEVLNGTAVDFVAIDNLVTLDVQAADTIDFNDTVTNVGDWITEAGVLTTVDFAQLSVDSAEFHGPVEFTQTLEILATNNVLIEGPLQGSTGAEDFTIDATDIDLGDFSQISLVTLDGSSSIRLSGTQSAATFEATTTDFTGESQLTVGTGTLTVTAETMDITGTATLTANAGIVLIPLDTSTSVGLGGTIGDPAAGTFNLTAAEIGRFASTGTMTIGRADLAATVTTHELDISGEQFDLTLLAGAGSDLNILQALTIGANNLLVTTPTCITIADAVSATGAAAIGMDAIDAITFTDNGTASTATGLLEFTSGNTITFEQSMVNVLSTAGGQLHLMTNDVRIDADSAFTTGPAGGNIVIDAAVTSQSNSLFDLSLTAGTGTINFNDTVDSLDALTVTSADDVVFASTIMDFNVLDITATDLTRFQGDVTGVGQLTTAATGTTQFETGIFSVDTANFGNDVLLMTSVDFTATGAVTFASRVDGNAATHSLVLDAGGDVRFEDEVATLDELNVSTVAGQEIVYVGQVTSIGTLTTGAGGRTVVETDLISADVATFNNPTRIENDVVMQIAGALQFTSAGESIYTASNGSLDITAGSTQVDGSISNLTSLDVTAAGETRFNGNFVNIDAVQTDGGGETVFGGMQTLEIGTATFTDAVRMLDDVTINATGAVAFQNTLDADGADVDLDITSASATFTGIVSDFASLNVTAAGATRFNANVTDVAVLQTDGGGTTVFSGNQTVSIGTGTFGDQVDLEGDVTFDVGTSLEFQSLVQGTVADVDLEITSAAAAPVTFGAGVADLESLLVTTVGTTRFTGDVTNVNSLQTNGGGTTVFTGTQSLQIGQATFDDAVELEGNVDITATGAVSFLNGITGTNAAELSVDAAGTTRFTGNITDVAMLETTGGGETVFTGNQTLTIGSASFDDNVRLEGDVTLNATGSVDFNGELAGDTIAELVIDTGSDITFHSGVSDLALLDVTAMDEVRIIGSVTDVTTLNVDAATRTILETPSISVGTAMFSGDVTVRTSLMLNAAGDVTFNDPVSGETGTEQLQMTSGEDIVFGDTLSQLQTVTLNATDTILFSGNLTDVGTLVATSGMGTTLDAASFNITDATFNGDVLLTQDVTFVDGTSLVFNDNVQGITGAESLFIGPTAGDVTVVGTVSNLTDLVLNGPDDVDFQSAVTVSDLLQIIGATGSVNFSGPVSAGTISLAGDSLEIHDNMTATTGGITLDAVDSVLIDATIETTAPAAAAISIEAGQMIEFTAQGHVINQTGGTTTLTADDSTPAGTSQILMADGSSVETTGSIEMNAAGDMTVAHVLSDTSLINAITVTSRNGAIIDAGDSAREFVTDGRLTIQSAIGIGSADRLEINVGEVDLENAAGNIQLTDETTLDVVGISQTGMGNVLVITEAGPMSVLGSGTGVSTVGGLITLDAQGGGSLLVEQQISSLGGDVMLFADTGIQTGMSGSVVTTGVTGVDGGALTIQVRGTGDVLLEQRLETSVANGGAGPARNAGTITITTADGSVFTDRILANGGTAAGGNGDGSLISITANGGSIELRGETTTVGDTDGEVVMTATDSILDRADGQTLINAGRASFTAGQSIGEISDFAMATGNAIDLQLSVALDRAEVQQAGGEIHLHHTGDLFVSDGAIILDADGAADLVVTSTGGLDIGTDGTGLVTSTGDDVHLVAGTDLVLQDSGINVGEGQLRLTGVNDIVDASGRELGLLTAQDLFVRSGSVGGETRLLTSVDTLDAELTTSGRVLTVIENDAIVLNRVHTVDADFNLEAATVAAGDITVVDIQAGVATVELIGTDNTSRIVNGGGAGRTIQAQSLAISVTDGVADNDRLAVEVENLAVETTRGDINLIDLSDGLTITNVRSVSGASISAGDGDDHIDLRTVGSMQVDSEVRNTGGGNVLLAATGETDADLTIDARVAAESGTGNVALTAVRNVSLDGAAAIETDQTGEILVSAGEDRLLTGTVDGVNDAAIFMNATSTIASDAGDVLLRASGDVTLSSVNADADTNGVRGDVTIIADFAGVDGSLMRGLGAVSESTPEGVTNITGDALEIQAATGIGSSDDLRTDVATLLGVNDVSGDVRIFEIVGAGDNDLEVLGIANTAGSIDVMTGDGSLQVTGDVSTTGAGQVRIVSGDADVDGNGDLTITADITSETGSIALRADGQHVTVSNDAQIATTDGNIVLRSGATGDGDIILVDGSGVKTGTGTVSLTAFGDIFLSRVESTTGTAINITADGAVLDSGDQGTHDLVAEQGRVTITSGDGVGSGNALETAIGRLVVTNVDNNIEIFESTGLLVDGISQGAGDVILSSGNALTVTAAGTGLTTTGGNVDLTMRGAGEQFALNQDLQTNGGNVAISSAGGIDLGPDADLLTVGGSLNADAADAFVMNPTSQIDTLSGTIDVTAGQNIVVSQIGTTTDLTLDSTNGGVVNAMSDATVNLRAERLAISSATGVGSAAAMQTDVRTLAIENDQSGSIRIVNQSTDELVIGQFAGVTGISNRGGSEGDIGVFNQGSMTVSNAINNLSGGDITLTADAAASGTDLTIDSMIFATPSGAITLNAGRDLLINDSGEEFDIFGGSVTGSAGDDVEIADDVIVRSRTGSVVQDLPLIENIVTPQVLASGDASVSGDFGRLFEQNYTIFVDWADGTVDANFENNPTPESFTYNHTYDGNPNAANPAAPIPITVSIIDDPNITFFEGGEEVLLPSITSVADVPGEGLASGFVYDLSIEVPELGAVSSTFAEAIETEQTDAVQDQETSENTGVTEEVQTLDERIVKLRVFNAAGEVAEEITLKGDQALMILNDFVGFVEKYDLPDGRYQILQQEPGESTPRVVFDLLLRNGRPADNSDGLQDRPPTAEEFMQRNGEEIPTEGNSEQTPSSPDPTNTTPQNDSTSNADEIQP
ncbi:beta strand repeat-containing protein [Rubinisphaera margarita]|uniref:beta strand repeat-containing protein n=1 Tax=Rubinisphaera margarita TaxID=2909586 RepID=UPI001EE8E586|nr:hypothetical protein [Rubinisphaera margarita]MCG6157852.1 hypothetical protein [Rubinisphaera margarita]